jgi:ankyrin repeat protein
MRQVDHAFRLLLLALCLAAPAAGHAQTRDEARQRLALMGLEPGIERLVQFSGQGDLQVVLLLLASGVAAGGSGPGLQATPMHAAAAQGHAQVLAALLEHGAGIDPADRDGNTPLVNAAYHGHLEAVRLLIARGANVNAATADGSTALAAAVYSGSGDVLRELLAHGAAPAVANKAGETPAALAERAGRVAMAAALRQAAGR